MRFRCLTCVFWSFAATLGLLPAVPVISEFMASNSSTLRDDDGDFSDWIEIHNPTQGALDLAGWHLTDSASNRTKWRFPSVTLPANGYLVVFASNKNRRLPGQPLHTNFALSADGEYLALVAPDGFTRTTEFAPSFPPQLTNVSYGFPSNVATAALITQSAACRWIVPSSSTNPATNWRDRGFNDGSWSAAIQGIGYDRDPSGVNFLPEIGSGGNTESAMYRNSAFATSTRNCYLRIPFQVANAADILALRLRAKFDDGFVAYLNGQPLRSGGTELRRNAPNNLAWNSNATASNDDNAAIQWAEFDVSESLGGLVNGANVLAVQGLNRGVSSSDFLQRYELIAETVADLPAAAAPGFFGSATPGKRNGGPNSQIIPQEVAFSRAQGTFIDNFTLGLSGAVPGQQIRYTTDGSEPTLSSTLYGNPFPISGSTRVRARIFQSATAAAGIISAANYEKLTTTLTSYASTGQPFRSALPILIINRYGGGEIPNDDTPRDVRVHVIDRNASGYASITGAPSLNTFAGMKLRGSSSSGFDKKSYSLEFRDETLEERNQPVLGMPAESDWALISCDDFDASFMRNAWVYEAGRRTGRWSPRTRFVELFFNFDGDDLEFADHRGVYVLCENIRNGGDRSDVTKLEPGATVQPGVSGGYVFKVDRWDSDEFTWRTTRNLPLASLGGALVIHRPKLPVLAPQQSAYLVNHFQAFENTLFADAATGFSTRNYRNFIDSPSWIDHNLFNMFPKNVDGLRLSAYFLKDRGRPIEGGPLWDFDRSADSTDSRDDEFNTWHGTPDSTNFFTYAWWQQLFNDIEFRQAYVDRWQELRAGVLSNREITNIIDGFVAEFRVSDADNPARRDYAKWYPSQSGKNLLTETAILKNWLINRGAWIDSQFTARPIINTPAGPVTVGQTIGIVIPQGTTVYYRLDGLDPRAEGGGVRPGTVTYSGGPITLQASSRLTARAFRPGNFAIPATNWSGMAERLYLVDEDYANAATLRVTGLHYNPLGPDATELAAMPELAASDFEWIEVTNAGDGPINLEGVALVAGQPVSAMTLPPFTLAPGARGVLVKNRQAFLLRHPAAAGRIIAEWRGDKSLANDGEPVRIIDRDGTDIASFRYSNAGGWPSRADGDGGALEFLGAESSTAAYETPSNWRTSAEIHGQPGTGGSGPRDRVRINEVLASAVWPQVDAIELFNPTIEPVDLGGWFLSNKSVANTVSDYQLFRIPDGTVIPPGGFMVFTEADFNPNGDWNPSGGLSTEGEFQLDGFRGGRVWLISADSATGRLDAFEDHADFTPAAPGVALGRWPDGSGDLIPLAAPTLLASHGTPLAAAGASNATPRSGAIQLSEIMYHPLLGTAEYLEIANTGAVTESLDQWTLRGDVDFYFSPGTTVAPGESLLIVPFDPINATLAAAAFREQYGVPSTTRLLGPWSGSAGLHDAAGEVRLRRAIDPPAEDPFWLGLMIEDEVLYRSTAPWPLGASGTGSAIHRLGTTHWGSDPTAWAASPPTPGREAGGFPGWQREFFPAAGPLTGAADDFDGDGLANHLEFLFGTDPTAPDPSPLRHFLDPTSPGDVLVMEYRRRRDRMEFPLTPMASPDLDDWAAAVDDRHHALDGLYEIRRTYLPLDTGRGFLRLESPVNP
jgi:hypothetical protein